MSKNLLHHVMGRRATLSADALNIIRPPAEKPEGSSKLPWAQSQRVDVILAWWDDESEEALAQILPTSSLALKAGEMEVVPLDLLTLHGFYCPTCGG